MKVATSYHADLNLAKAIARKAGRIMLHYFDGQQQLSHKDDGSELTIADTKINRLVIEELAKVSDDALVGEEESTGGYGQGRLWFCDPIDGTKPYSWGVPTAMFSLGLVEDGKPVVGVAYDPFLDRLYEAVAGGQALCNDHPVRVSEAGIDGASVSISTHVPEVLKLAEHYEGLMRLGIKLAAFPGAVYKNSRVANGRHEGFIGYKVNAWDMAAMHVIVEAAGGKVTAPDGSELDYSQPFKGAVSSNGRIHDQLLGALAS
jgi:myo-inositol-1(or 4)-monophosphatase